MEGQKNVERAFDHVFQHPELLCAALTHSSWANECGGGAVHNERQEFLGDAVLELCVSWELFHRFPTAREGDLTRMRSELVSTGALAALARELGLEDALRLGKGEENQGGRHRDTLLSDAFEAVLGAVFEDGGFAAAQRSVAHIFQKHWPERLEYTLHKDFKTRLQEVTQRLFQERPVYTMVGSEGPEHAKRFEVRVLLPDGRTFTGMGPSVKRAEQEAAHQALEVCDQGTDL